VAPAVSVAPVYGRWLPRLLLVVWVAWVLALAWMSRDRWTQARPEPKQQNVLPQLLPPENGR